MIRHIPEYNQGTTLPQGFTIQAKEVILFQWYLKSSSILRYGHTQTNMSVYIMFYDVLCIYVQAIESFTFANACILYTYTHTRMHTHTDIQTYMHTCIHTHTHTHTYTYIHKYKYKYACKYMHLSLYIHTCHTPFISFVVITKNVLSKNVQPKKNTGKNKPTLFRPEQRGTRRVQATSLTKRCT